MCFITRFIIFTDFINNLVGGEIRLKSQEASAVQSSSPMNSILREVSPNMRFSPLPSLISIILRHVRVCSTVPR